MRRKALIVLLSLGVVVGFGSGIARLLGHRHGHHGPQRWAEICAQAALEAGGKPAASGKD
jgi:hypothetical protein